MIQIHFLYGQVFSCHLQPSPAADPRNDLHTNASLCEEISKKFTKYLSQELPLPARLTRRGNLGSSNAKAEQNKLASEAHQLALSCNTSRGNKLRQECKMS